MISIIVPVYNKEKYLKAMLESILSQTYKDFEVILVDDGSIDTSYKICNNYSENYNFIKTITQQNSGVSHARNVGFDNSMGELILFVDADDELMPDMLEVLVNNMVVTKADISICSYCRKRQDKLEHVRDSKTLWVYDGDEKFEKFFDATIGIGMWNKLLKREIAQKIEFEVGKSINEDKFYLFEALNNCNRICFQDVSKYIYIMREQSISTTKNPIPIFDMVYFANKTKQACEGKNNNIRELSEQAYLKTCLYAHRLITYYGGYEKVRDKSQEIRELLLGIDKKIVKKLKKKYLFEYQLLKNKGLYKCFIKLYYSKFVTNIIGK